MSWEISILIGRGFDKRPTCLTCGKPYGVQDVTYGGRCLNCVGDDKVKSLLSPEYQDVGTNPKHVGYFHGLQHQDTTGKKAALKRLEYREFGDDNEDTPTIGQDATYHKTTFDFGDTVAFTEHGSGKGYSERSVKGLKRGTLERPWGYGEKYHTEGDVGT